MPYDYSRLPFRETQIANQEKLFNNISNTAQDVMKGFVDSSKIIGNGINEAVQKNWSPSSFSPNNIIGGMGYSYITEKTVSAAIKGTAGGAFLQTGYDAVTNIAKGYYNYFAGNK